MSEGRAVDPRVAQDANRRYWDTQSSVNQIADDLGLSKSSLYGLIEQLGTGLACPDCGTELAFANRTARDRGVVSCPACGFEASSDDVEETVDSGISRGDRSTAGGSEALPNGRVLAGTALLGFAAGLVLGSMVRKR